jgi:formiminoglutamase
MSDIPEWLTIRRGGSPLLLSMPHTGIELPAEVARGLVSVTLARRDTDWWVDRLYDFAGELDATIVRTAISRTAIDVNRDPTGMPLYRGQATTELCPTTTFDGDALYAAGAEPDAAAIHRRTELYFAPYHSALTGEIARLRARQATVVLYDCHSIRSGIPRLFAGVLPQFNIGTRGATSCGSELAAAVRTVCESTSLETVLDGRFKGGYITHHYGRPAEGVHAIQMELACRGYMAEEPGPIDPECWPPDYDPARAAPMRAVLRRVLESCLDFAASARRA